MKIYLFALLIASTQASAMQCNEIRDHETEIKFQNDKLAHEDLPQADLNGQFLAYQQEVVNSIQENLNTIDDNSGEIKANLKRLDDIINTKYELDAAIGSDVALHKSIADAIESGLNAKNDAPTVENVLYQLNSIQVSPAVRKSLLAYIESLRASGIQKQTLLMESLKLTLKQLREPDSMKSDEFSDLLSSQLISLRDEQVGQGDHASERREKAYQKFVQADIKLATLKTKKHELDSVIQTRRDRIAYETRVLGNNQCIESRPTLLDSINTGAF